MKLFILLLLLLNVSIHAKYFKCNENLSCGCSSKNVEINARILLGEEVVPYSWSMIVSIRCDFFHNGDFLRHKCGGTILTGSYILTAASCLEEFRNNIKSANVTIAAGIHQRSQPIQIIREVDQMIIHPNWTIARNTDYDIALLHLSEPLEFQMNSMITRTCLSSQLNNPKELIQYPPSNTTLAVVGWGRTSLDGDDSDILRQNIVSSIDSNDTKCTHQVIDPTRQFCAGLHRDSIGPCYGDFGGPIFQWMNDHWEQIGIASFTSDNCETNSIVGYTRLAYYHDWIEENIKNTNETMEQITMTATISATDTTQIPSETYQCDKHIAPCGCGRRNVEISHLNNHEAIPYSWSMIVSIRLNHQNKHSCSGSILSESYILTSASCLANVSSFGITIVAGIHNHSEDNGIYRKVDQIFFHPDYIGSVNNNVNDIAILHISEILTFNNNLFISQICLPKKHEAVPDSIFYPAPNTRLIVTGWGLMNCKNETEQQLLQQIQVYSVNNVEKNCYVLDKHRQIQFCAGLNEENIVSCIRDPGSPIFQWIGDRWQQVGIASYGIDCVQFKNLGIYTRLIDYNDWIESIIKTYSTPSPTSTIPTRTPYITATKTPVNTTTKPVKIPELYRCNHTLTCGCGSIPVVLTPARIVGGEKAVDYSWPMMVSLRWPFENDHWCGGTIISNSYILTAAHCLSGYVTIPPEQLTISIGMTDLTDIKQIRRTVDHIYIHPNFTGPQGDLRHDIALVHINRSLTMGNNLFLTKTCIHPPNPTIPNDQYIKNGTRLTTIGWGLLEDQGVKRPTLLQQVEVYAIDNEDPTCIAAMNDSQTEFCAGLPEGGKDACGGDSGGPIFQWTGDYWEQVGIVSNGKGCAVPGNPGVYTRLSYFYDWINDILKNDNEHLEPIFSPSETSIKPNIPTTWTTTPNLPTTWTTTPNLPTTWTTTSNLPTTSTTTSKLSTTSTTTSNLPTTSTTTSKLPPTSTTTSNLPMTSTTKPNITATSTTTSNIPTTSTTTSKLPPTSTTTSNLPMTSTTKPNITATSATTSNIPTTSTTASNLSTTSTTKPNTPTTSITTANIPTTWTTTLNTTNTSTTNSNLTTTTTNESTSTRKNDAYNHQENTLLFSALALLFSMILQ